MSRNVFLYQLFRIRPELVRNRQIAINSYRLNECTGAGYLFSGAIQEPDLHFAYVRSKHWLFQLNVQTAYSPNGIDGLEQNHGHLRALHRLLRFYNSTVFADL